LSTDTFTTRVDPAVTVLFTLTAEITRILELCVRMWKHDQKTQE